MNKIKQQHGQFFTKNADYIVEDLIEELIQHSVFIRTLDNGNTTFIDPFAGECDLLNLIPNEWNKEAYDIDPKSSTVLERDSLIYPPNYLNKWIITNPPWLAKNKNKRSFFKNLKEEEIYLSNSDAYCLHSVNDLYKAALKTLFLTKEYQENISKCEISFKNDILTYPITPVNGGIIIIPLNFWCEEQQSLRTWFLDKFKILKVKIFEEQVFEDTTYTCCAFLFIRKDLFNISDNYQDVIFEFWRGSKFNNGLFIQGNKKPYLTKTWKLTRKNDYIIGEDYVQFIEENKKIDIEVKRLVKNDTSKNSLVLYAQDTGTKEGKIKLKREYTFYVDKTPNLTDRVKAGIKILKNNKEIELTENQQDRIAKRFNQKLEYFRQQYNSLCLTNYRNSTKELARKRISFDSAYALIKWCLKEENLI